MFLKPSVVIMSDIIDGQKRVSSLLDFSSDIVLNNDLALRKNLYNLFVLRQKCVCSRKEVANKKISLPFQEANRGDLRKTSFESRANQSLQTEVHPNQEGSLQAHCRPWTLLSETTS